MSHLTGKERDQYVRKMFAAVAPRYDLLNRVMTGGQDIRWRKESVRRLGVKGGDVVLDAGAGTGDFAFEIKKQHPDTFIVASDLTPEMLAIGKARAAVDEGIGWVIADAQHLPFQRETFDRVISGFLMRNVGLLDVAIQEQHRVLAEDGSVVVLDTTPARPSLLRPLVVFFMARVIPVLGRVIAGNPEAYQYLPSSTEGFVSAESLADRMRAAGFKGVSFVIRMFGTVSIHQGQK
jgi:demethylmenaquinone methyltransferase/2-methoxy-6-polyprenyl-1,4-benzoquinol methylase